MNRHNRGLVQNDTLRRCVDDGIDRAEIYSQILGKETTEDIHNCLPRLIEIENINATHMPSKTTGKTGSYLQTVALFRVTSPKLWISIPPKAPPDNRTHRE